jgi:hypothetical protein
MIARKPDRLQRPGRSSGDAHSEPDPHGDGAGNHQQAHERDRIDVRWRLA